MNEHHVPEQSLKIHETDDLPPDVVMRRLDLPYPPRWFAPLQQHPRAWEIEEETVSWMQGLRLLPKTEQLEVVRAMCPRIYGGSSASMPPYEHALLYTKYLTMWLLWDDETAESTTDMAHLRTDFDAMAGMNTPDVVDTPYSAAWRYIGDQLERMGGSITLRARWVDTMRDYAEHAVLEGKVRRGETDHPSHAEALRVRGHTIGAMPAITYLEACCGIELPPQITDTEQYREIAWRSALLQGIQNDLASIAKDLRQNQVSTNVVLRQWDRTGGTLLEACETIIRIHDTAVAEFDASADELLDHTEPSLRARVNSYLDYVRFMETGFGFYHVQAHRYAQLTAVEAGYGYKIALVRQPN